MTGPICDVEGENSHGTFSFIFDVGCRWEADIDYLPMETVVESLTLRPKPGISQTYGSERIIVRCLRLGKTGGLLLLPMDNGKYK